MCCVRQIQDDLRQLHCPLPDAYSHSNSDSHSDADPDANSYSYANATSDQLYGHLHQLFALSPGRDLLLQERDTVTGLSPSLHQS